VLEPEACWCEEWWKDRGRLKLRSAVIEAQDIERLLRNLGEPLEPPKRANQLLQRKF
jgi:hypothetical protein